MTDWETELHNFGSALAGAERELALLQRELEQERAAHAETKRRLYEYENMVNWNVSCRHCAGLLDGMYEETCRRERAEEAVIRMTPVLAAARGLIDHLLEGDEPVHLWTGLLGDEVRRYVKTLNEE